MSNGPTTGRDGSGFARFATIWSGQTVSMIGSGLTGFALAVWLFQQTGNATPMAITALSQWVPRILLAPVAGMVADRYSRKLVMLAADTGAAVTTAAGAWLVAAGNLQVWHVYLLAMMIGSFGAFQDPAFTASITLLVDKRHYARAAGMRQASAALEAIAAPLVAGLLMGVIGLAGVILIDLATFAVGLLTLLPVRVPNPDRSASPEAGVSGGGLREALYGMRYIAARRGLLAMLVYFAIVNFFANMSSVLLPPLVLSFSDAAGLGVAQTAGGAGMLVGSLVVSVWGGPKRRMRAVYASILMAGAGLIVVSSHASLSVVAIGLFLMLLLIPVASGALTAIWQSKVEPGVQGRVFAARSMFATATMPLAFGLSGPLADRVFQPLMEHAPPAALTALVGTGPGRGYALLFLLGGAVLIVATAVFGAYRPLRRVDEELPDYDAAAPCAAAAGEPDPALSDAD